MDAKPDDAGKKGQQFGALTRMKGAFLARAHCQHARWSNRSRIEACKCGGPNLFGAIAEYLSFIRQIGQ